ncbi:hypothetical protein [uncultured Algoriphagus sp.]|uniref:hypothetical protein n=1 Tax=uncultured Algoriphagus sp. TaxID=417365 RepID=UPI0030EC4906
MKRSFLSTGVPCQDGTIVFKVGLLILDATNGNSEEDIPNTLKNIITVGTTAAISKTFLLFIEYLLNF